MVVGRDPRLSVCGSPTTSSTSSPTAPLAGNPLAVFLEGEGVDAATMQAIARELNLSETVFGSVQDQELA